MAEPLIWLPLNGTLENIGLSKITRTSSADPSYYDDGKIGKAYNLNVRSTFTCEDIVNLESFSVCFWAKTLPSATLTTNWQDVLGFSDMNLSSAAGQFRFETCYNYASGIGVHWHNNSTNSIVDGSVNYFNEREVWHHCAFTVESGISAKSFVDGNLISTHAASSLGGGHLTGTFWIGETNNIEGALNDVRVYGSALSEKEIRDISRALVLHYPLDEDGHLTNNHGAEIVYDCSGYHHDGAYLGSPTNAVDTAKYEKSTTLNGTTDGISVNTPDLNTVINNSFSVSFWIKSSSGRVEGNYSSVDPYYESRFGKGLNLLWNGVSGGWHHVVLVCNGLNETFSYYDGELRQHSTTPRTVTTFSDSWVIGKNAGTVSGTPYNGKMSDFRIYATALSATDVKYLYDIGASIDNKQNVHTRDYVEEETPVKIRKTGVIKSKEFTEAERASIFDSGDMSAADFIEI